MVDITIQGGFPRSVVAGVGGLVLLTIVIAGTARATHKNHIVMPPSAALASIDLTFKDLPNGGVAVNEAGTGRLVSTVAPETGGFLRGIMRGLVRDHRLAGKPAGTSFRLTQWADGRLSLEDPMTRESYDLEAFGTTNEQVFARFLDRPGRT